jgi:hypothetical protein
VTIILGRELVVATPGIIMQILMNVGQIPQVELPSQEIAFVLTLNSVQHHRAAIKPVIISAVIGKNVNAKVIGSCNV